MLRRLEVLSAFSNFGIFDLQWVYQDLVPLSVEEYL